MDKQIRVADNPTRSRYEVHSHDELLGYAAYRLDGERITFTHTEIDPCLGCREVGATLARHALDDARGRGLQVVAECSYLDGWIGRHSRLTGSLASPATS